MPGHFHKESTMTRSKTRILIPVLLVFIIYIVWLVRAYADVAYMDQIQIIAGNMKNMCNHDASLLDFYYRPPFLLMVSTVLVFINCKLFAYNTYLETITSGLILLWIAVYFVRAMGKFFTTRKYRFYLSVMTALIVFGWSKWEMSLWGGGFSHFMVVLFGFVCLHGALRYMLRSDGDDPKTQRLFLPSFLLLSVLAILETTSYFLPFLLSLVLMLLLSRRIFTGRINFIRWKTIFIATLCLLVFAIGVNYAAEVYSAHHPYDAYGKVNLSQSMLVSLKKAIHQPLFVIKFFLISNAGNLLNKDFYPASSPAKDLMPFLGLIVLVCYGYAVLLFVKKRRIEGMFPIALIFYTIIFCLTVLAGRMYFDDVYYGASSRYAAATFSGMLGLATFFLILLKDEEASRGWKRLFYKVPVVMIAIGTLVFDRTQWIMAPYYKENFLKMEANLKADQHLETLAGYNNEITEKARQVMISNKLNVFKPRKKLKDYRLLTVDMPADAPGFYPADKDEFGAFRWTDGKGIILLPNLYTVGDTVTLKIACYSPQADTPAVLLNDKLRPFRAAPIDGGFEYAFAFTEQKVLYNLVIENRSVVPHEVNQHSTDTRKLGLIFRSASLSE